MANEASNPPGGLVLRRGQALIAIPDEENGEEITRYFAGIEAADAWRSQHAVTDARALIGAWADLDWEETLDALDRIRHESTPTPPIDDL